MHLSTSIYFNTSVRRVEYSLTERGQSLRPVLNAMIKWGIEHQKDYAIGDFGMAIFQK